MGWCSTVPRDNETPREHDARSPPTPHRSDAGRHERSDSPSFFERSPEMAGRSKKSANSGVPKAVLEKQKKLIPTRLAQVRGGRSQRSFARELGVFQQNVNRYESGTTPHADFLITLAVKEGISLDWLLMGKGRAKR